MRGFKICKGFENKEINLPKRATRYSAGYDIESCIDVIIKPGEIKMVPTGLKAYMGEDEVLKIYARSSLGFKKQLLLANSVGIIDKDYFENIDNDGHINVVLYNFGTKEVSLSKGERIAQGIFEKYLLTEDDSAFDTRQGGFGSTSK